MIKIEKNKINKIPLTLTERNKDNLNLFMLIYSNQNHNSKILNLKTDISTNKQRFNLFNIEENNTEDLENQIINLECTTYDYFVYKTTETIFANYDIDNSIMIESGKLIVNGVEETKTTYEDTKNEYTYYE